MEFRITRTSGDVKKPCEKAYLKKGYENWFVEIKTLKALIKLSEKEGEIIISKYWLISTHRECPEIEIYDDYRE